MIEISTYDDVVAAAARIAPYAVRTPLVESAVLSDRFGARIFLKIEIFQRTGSFKFRGALNRILLIPERERAGGVVAFSSGNHAQGVASVAKLFGMKAVIVMPSDAPRPKIDGTRAMGAEIVLYDRQRDDREAIAARIREERSATLIKPFDDPGIIAGQGTVGLEIAQDSARLGVTLDAVLAPCSGGGLVTGTALGLKGGGSHARVHSVEPENYDGMRRSLAAGTRLSAPGGKLSIADALMAPMPGAHVFELAKNLLGEGLAVRDDELERAVAFAALHLKLLVEPGGAAALAVLLAGKAPLSPPHARSALAGEVRSDSVRTVAGPGGGNNERSGGPFVPLTASQGRGGKKSGNLALVLSGGNAEFAAIADIVQRWPEV